MKSLDSPSLPAESLDHATQHLQATVSAIPVRAFHGKIRLNQPVDIDPITACACIRGIIGHILYEYAPDMLYNFKPGNRGHLPAPYVIQALPPITNQHIHTEFAFSFLSWENSGTFIRQVLKLIQYATARPWGHTGAHITTIEYTPITLLDTSSLHPDPTCSSSLVLRTPVILKSHVRNQTHPNRKHTARKRLTPQQLSLQTIVRAQIMRINLLSQYYGNTASIDLEPFTRLTHTSQVVCSKLNMVSHFRGSSTQKNSIQLGGIIGFIQYNHLHPLLQQLLSYASFFHLGHHTTDGCGYMTLSPSEHSYEPNP
jgi:hypothetical protein